MQASIIDLAWAAGFIDGEGCLCCMEDPKRMSATGAPYRKVELAVGNTDIRPIIRLETLFGGRSYRKGRQKEHWGEQFHWVASGNLAVEIAEILLPFFVVKAEAAHRLIEWWEERPYGHLPKRRSHRRKSLTRIEL